jgi:hypothetical protein
MTGSLSLDRVLTLEHAVHVGEVVGARGEGLDLSLGLEVLLEVSLVAELAHL